MPDQPEYPDLSQMNRPLGEILAAMQSAEPKPLTREALDALAQQLWNAPVQHEPYLLAPGVTMRDLTNAELRRLGLPEISEEDMPC